MNDYDLISNEGYKDSADFVVVSNTTFDFNILKKDAIIFCKTDYIDFLFENIKFSNKKYVLITHYSDYYVDKVKFSKKPNCIKKWYAWAVLYKHEDLIPIPVGFSIFWDIKGVKHEDYLDYFYNNLERLKLVEKDNKTVYCNFTVDHLRPPRHQVVNKILANNVKCYVPPDGHTENGRMTFPDYCEDMAKFKFVASPFGNGGDSHRTWDAVYMKCIPIVQKNLYKSFDLPILEINDFSEVTNKLLEDYLEYYNTHEFKYEQSTLSYWINRMREDLKNKL